MDRKKSSSPVAEKSSPPPEVSLRPETVKVRAKLEKLVLKPYDFPEISFFNQVAGFYLILILYRRQLRGNSQAGKDNFSFLNMFLFLPFTLFLSF